MTKILIIEDEAVLRGEVMEWLGFENFEVIGAADGLLGVEAAREHLPDLIICDITMPRLDGYGVLIACRSDPITSDIPFIFMTARASHEDIRHGMSSGADDYITKPFTHRELLGSIHSRLEKKAALEYKRQEEVRQLQEALEQEQERRMLKAKIIAMFSHDFRNPLSSILLSNSIIQKYFDRMDAEQRAVHTGRIEASARQLLQMLDDMLVTAQLETGNLEFRPENVNARQLFAQIVEEFQVMYGDSHNLRFEGDYGKSLYADPRLLRHIAVNLISNAVKYSPEGGEVLVSVDGDGKECALTVEDHGIGIPAEDQTRLFGAFQRGSNVGRISGTGLGLALVKQAADMHAGIVELESAVGVGTRITVRIPVK